MIQLSLSCVPVFFFSTGQERSQQNDEVIPQVIDATYAMANTLHTLQIQYCGNANQKVCPELLTVDGDTFIETLRDVTDFTSINDERRVTFDYQLSLDYSYNVMNVQEGQLVQVSKPYDSTKTIAANPLPPPPPKKSTIFLLTVPDIGTYKENAKRFENTASNQIS